MSGGWIISVYVMYAFCVCKRDIYVYYNLCETSCVWLSECMLVYIMSPSSMLKLDLRLESTDASGDIAESSGSPPIGDKGSSIIRKPRSPLLAWTSSPPRSPSPDMPSENPDIPSHKSSDWAKSKCWELPTAGYWMGGWGWRCCGTGGSCLGSGWAWPWGWKCVWERNWCCWAWGWAWLWGRCWCWWCACAWGWEWFSSRLVSCFI